MSSGPKKPLAEAALVATAIVETLRPACERIEIAGSIRRRKPEVSDIELVCVPRLVDGPSVDLFAAPPKESLLDIFLLDLERSGRLVQHPTSRADGERYKKRWAPRAGMQVDLFIVPPGGPAEWGVIFAIRTGPADYSARAVTALHDHGLRSVDGRILRGNEVMPCPEEADFFRLAGLPLLPPEERR